MIQRCILIVLDSVGAGAMPDAASYGDAGADTLGHVFEAMGSGFSLPHLASLGLYQLLPARRADAPATLTGCFGTMACASPAKDTTAGHWELAGVVLDHPFPVYPHGFPRVLMDEFERRIGTKTLGNSPASGTEIIARLGEEHCRTGFPIVYTSADSVFQIAAHEECFGLERLYECCRTARELLTGEHAVGRVIARPFTGSPGSYTRTLNRRDYSLSPAGPTILDAVTGAGGAVTGIGKIEDIFNGKGITKAVHTHTNAEGMQATLEEVSRVDGRKPGLILTNLVDFDMMWGHRRDVLSYAHGLRAFDDFLPQLFAAMREDDMLLVTADHGCDPTFIAHTDHTREYVPVLAYGPRLRAGVALGVRRTFADAAQTIADFFGLPPLQNGTSFRALIEKKI